MAGTTRTKSTPATTAPAVEANPLDLFREQLVERHGVVTRTKQQAILATVLLGETLGGMFAAIDDTTPPVKETAPKSEQVARRKGIENKVIDYVSTVTGHFYSWTGVEAWVDAARVNLTLPDDLQVKLVGSGDDAVPVGHFGVWPLRALGRIEDEKIRATTAEQLVAAGVTTQDGVEAKVNEVNGVTPTKREPVAAADMTKAVVTKLEKREAGPLATLRHIALGVDADDLLAAIDFGRIAWVATPSDPAIDDLDKRKAKRLEVFRAAIEQLTYAGRSDDDDGVDDSDAKS